MTNNVSERALRPIAVGRKAWLFFGSDDHATAAANLFSLIASCQLHDLDAETYLAEIFRVLPYWPRDRFLELAPKYWAAIQVALARRSRFVKPLDGVMRIPLALGHAFRRDLGTDSGGTWARIPEHLGSRSGAPGHRFRRTWARARSGLRPAGRSA